MGNPLNRRALEHFCGRWAPTILSFATLYLGNEAAAFEVSVDALARYMEVSDELDMERMPLRLWECVVSSVTRPSPTIESKSVPDFCDAVLKLDRSERLVYLLRNAFALPVKHIMLITKRPEETIASLAESATLKLSESFGSSKELEVSSLSREFIATEAPDARGRLPARRYLVN